MLFYDDDDFSESRWTAEIIDDELKNSVMESFLCDANKRTNITIFWTLDPSPLYIQTDMTMDIIIIIIITLKLCSPTLR